MDLPQPPPDQELKNIIDKLAQFVARNGPEFEQMTKSKQKDNPKFSFLFGGDYFNYYQYKVTTEQAIIKHRQQQQIIQQHAAPSHPQQNITTVSSLQSNTPQSYPPSIASYPNAQYPGYTYPQTNMTQQQQQQPPPPPPPQQQQQYPPSNYPNSQGSYAPNAGYNNQGSSGYQNQQNDGGYGNGSIPPVSHYQDNSLSSHSGAPGTENSQSTIPLPPSMPSNGTTGYGDNSYNSSDSQQHSHYDSTTDSQQQHSHYDTQEHHQHQDQQHHQQQEQQQHHQQMPPISENYQSMTNSMSSVSVSGVSNNSLEGSNYPPSSDGNYPSAPQPPSTDLSTQQQYNQSSHPPVMQQVTDSSAGAAAGGATAATTAAIDGIVQQQQTLQEQIKQSEQNLSAQHQVLQQQKDTQVKESVYAARGELLMKEAEELNLEPLELSELLTTITESCTKDSISAGKLWIFTNASDGPRNNWIARYLCYKATNYTSPFTHKLHIIYLMNDVLHSCVRKGSVELKERLEDVLVPMFCHSFSTAPEDKKSKLDKLLSLWETKLELETNIMTKLQNPVESLASVEKVYLEKFPLVTHTVSHHIDTTFEGYKQQHNAFVQHAATQLQQLEQQKQQLEQQQAAALVAAQQQQQQLPQPSLDQLCLPPPGFPAPGTGGAAPPVPIVDFSKPPPGFMGPPVMPPDMMGGPHPPMDGSMMQHKENLVPSVPYFELPAGLMCPMVPDHEHKYRPIDPSKLRLPAPAPPSERLLQAVENFYEPPSHDRPRNSEGWEQLSLYDYYKNKSEAVKRKQEAVDKGDRERSESPELVVIIPASQEKLDTDGPLRRYRSVSPEKEQPNENNDRDRMQNRTPTRRSPGRGDGREIYSPTRSPPRSERRSPPSSRRSPPSRRSPRRSSPPSWRNSSPGRRSPLGGSRRSPPSSSRRSPIRRSPRRTRSRSLSPKSRSRSVSPSAVDRVPFKRSPSRSPSPPSFGSSSFAVPDTRLTESNKGHQMLKKMGWGGSGLGLKEQGIENPIDAGEVRDNPQERFRGLGIPTAKNDPFEAFRKNKGKAFISRMKARAEEKM